MAATPQRRNALRARLLLAAAGMAAACGGEAAPVEEGLVVADAGFMTPESVLMDTVADVYLVSNINGGPTDQDDNGFISRVTPDGQVEQLKWIDGESPDVTLHAPKGMAIRGDSLYVADIECIRVYNRVTGAAVASTCVAGATFLNDVAIGDDGSLYVTDSGLRAGAAGLEPTGSDAVYRLFMEEGRQNVTLAKSAELGAPNGVAVGTRGIMVATFSSGEIIVYDGAGGSRTVVPASNRQLDGIALLPDGGFLFSSWRDSAVYRVNAAGHVDRVVAGVASPADIGFDARRNRILIPVFTENRVVIRDLPVAPQ
jgi:sugar lactone lactonase YvrE